MSLRATLYRVVPPAVRKPLAGSSLLKPLRDAVLRPGGREAIVTGPVRFEGLEFQFSAPPRVLVHAQDGGIEARICRLAMAHRAPGAVLVDVGASWGFTSLVMGVDPPGGGVCLFALEADPERFEVLRHNLAENTAWSTHHALCARVGEVDRPPWEVSLDGLVQRHGLTRFDFLKIDTDGADLSVLQGARETLARFHPTVVVELSDNAAEIHRLLTDLGYVTTDGMGRLVDGPPWPENLVAGREALTYPPRGAHG